jgi:hypothetical protein
LQNKPALPGLQNRPAQPRRPAFVAPKGKPRKERR